MCAEVVLPKSKFLLRKAITIEPESRQERSSTSVYGASASAMATPERKPYRHIVFEKTVYTD